MKISGIKGTGRYTKYITTTLGRPMQISGITETLHIKMKLFLITRVVIVSALHNSSKAYGGQFKKKCLNDPMPLTSSAL